MKKLFTLWLMILGLSSAFSQEESTNENEVDEIIDNLLMENQDMEAFLESVTEFQFVYLSVNYTDDTYFSGRDIGIDQYNIRPQITYMHSKGFFVSLSGVYYSEFTPKWDYTTVALGYGTSLDKKNLLRLYTSYSRYFYAEDAENPFTNAISVGLGIKNKKRTLGTQLTGTYLFGEDNSFQIDSRTFIAFQLVKTKTMGIKFKPQLNLVAGQQTLELAQTTFQNGAITTNYLENDVFDLINTQLNLPLQFNSNSFDMELGYSLNFPTELANEFDLPITGFFNLSIAYMIDL